MLLISAVWTRLPPGRTLRSLPSGTDLDQREKGRVPVAMALMQACGKLQRRGALAYGFTIQKVDVT
jgi:hypothetical protein